ncbi:MAG: Formation of crista junctions protein 1 [Claussenomyces sp. TS43310]|nr:MAG: Formation of crista junctions protein 1 [Claussenomyces sp. TS43310]
MLRASLQSSRALGNASKASRAGRQWQTVQATGRSSIARRYFADEKKPSIADSTPVVLPGSGSASTSEPVPQGPIATTPSSSLRGTSSTSPPTPTTGDIPPANIPLTPPPPPPSKIPHLSPYAVDSPSLAPSEPQTASPDPVSTLPARKPRRFFRKLFTTLLFLSIAGFGGGVYYAQTSDNFHDFFTEYIPFGEEAVLYFEEREFRKRFPPVGSRSRVRDTGETVKIPSQSGVSWRVAQDDKLSSAEAPRSLKPGDAELHPSFAKTEEMAKAVEQVKTGAAKSVDPSLSPSNTAPEPEPAPKKEPEPSPQTASPKVATASRDPEVDEPSRFPTEVTRIDPINIKGANEPLVQDLVKIFNDIILVVNADNANAKFTSTISKAKNELAKVDGKLKLLKEAALKEADEKIKSSHDDFDRGAKELIRRLEAEMQDQEAQWREDYEKERQKLQENYEQKLKSEIERANQVNEQRIRNELLEQAVEMKRKFVAEVKDRVEEERNGRLGKLSDLSNTVNELEKLTTDWNSVVDTNLKTQQLHVAVEAVRANLEKAQTPRPFIRELAALKEIAADDAVVNAAIASIDPAAYQRGIPSSAQLIDRFRRVAGEVRKASLLPEEAGVASHASSYVLSKILFKKKGLASGDDVESILTRTETLLEEGNLDDATREMNGLHGWAKTLSKDWLSEARRVLEVQQALDVIATEARLQSLRVE